MYWYNLIITRLLQSYKEVLRKYKKGIQLKIPPDFQIAIQFLEPSPRVVDYDPTLVRDKLRIALSTLPISILIIGWDIPLNFVEICREETNKRGIKLFRWQPLLTSDGDLPVTKDYQVFCLNGRPVPGFMNMPSFTLMCPNHAPYREQILEHIADILRPGKYDGIFLDRMRYPALTRDLSASLACFCPACQEAAEAVGLELSQVKLDINNLISTYKGRCELMRSLLLPDTVNHHSGDDNSITQYLAFRSNTITGIVSDVTQLARSFSAEVGLDCFSPAVSYSVGQDMHSLDKIGDWIKPMTYLHTFAPAGLPFEINEMNTFLGKVKNQEDTQNLNFLSQTMDFPIPTDQEVLMEKGLDSIVLTREITKAKRSTSNPTLVGIELVELPGVTWIEKNQLKKDMEAILDSMADGVVISWDLWNIQEENLHTIANAIRTHTG